MQITQEEARLIRANRAKVANDPDEIAWSNEEGGVTEGTTQDGYKVRVQEIYTGQWFASASDPQNGEFFDITDEPMASRGGAMFAAQAWFRTHPM